VGGGGGGTFRWAGDRGGVGEKKFRVAFFFPGAGDKNPGPAWGKNFFRPVFPSVLGASGGGNGWEGRWQKGSAKAPEGGGVKKNPGAGGGQKVLGESGPPPIGFFGGPPFRGFFFLPGVRIDFFGENPEFFSLGGFFPGAGPGGKKRGFFPVGLGGQKKNWFKERGENPPQKKTPRPPGAKKRKNFFPHFPGSAGFWVGFFSPLPGPPPHRGGPGDLEAKNWNPGGGLFPGFFCFFGILGPDWGFF